MGHCYAPTVIEPQVVFIGIHTGPEALMTIGHQLTGGSQPAEASGLQGVVFFQPVENFPAEYKEAAVDPVGQHRVLAHF